MIVTPEEVGLKGAKDEENCIIISNYTLNNILPNHINKMHSRYNVICDCECCISSKIKQSYLLSWRDSYLKNINTKVTIT